MQRDIFLKFVSEMEGNCKKLLIGSEIDYRRCMARGNSDEVRSLEFFINACMIDAISRP